ncbi:TrmB family transcriptional regulator [Natrialbaceae archaeon A-arb3/5]
MSTFQELGLSGYEERAYRALLAAGTATARTVTERSDVPEGRIYDVLNGLVTRGLATTQSGDPRRYTAVEPSQAIDRLLAERLAELEAKEDRYRQLATKARSTLAPTPPVDGNVWLADLGDDDSTTLVGEQLAAATDRFVMAVGPPYAGASVDGYRRELDAFVEHLPTGLTVDLLLDRSVVESLSAYISAVRDIDADVTIKQIEALEMTFDVVDGTEAYVDIPHPVLDGQRFGFLEVRDPPVASELERVFDEIWERATRIE